jgi:hypothetical protein
MKIYTNPFITSVELSPENFEEAFEEYASRLEEVAQTYRNLVKYVKTKKIKITEAVGSAHGGHFTVDDIDTERLKKDGFVIDYAEEPTAENPIFYVDAELDAELEKSREKLKSFSASDFFDDDDSYEDYDNYDESYSYEDEDELEDLTEEEREAIQALIENEDFDIAQIDIIIDDDPPTEKAQKFNLGKHLVEEVSPEPSFTPGDMIIEFEQIDESRYSFNLIIADLNEQFPKVNYIREKSLFEYDCGDCDTKHLQTLDSCFRSLKSANAILSHLIAMTQESKELSTALEFIDTDLRLLQWLLKCDYALNDGEEDETE